MISNYLKSNHLVLRLVEEDDANFILELRKNKVLNKYISPTEITLEEQKVWIKKYKEREKRKDEYYFIVESENKNMYGTVRIYNINYKESSVIWGSFIISPNRPRGTAMETIKLSTEFIFKELKIKKIKLDVRKENLKAIYIYEKIGFTRVKEDELNYYYELRN